jgi:hypothetical protein
MNTHQCFWRKKMSKDFFTFDDEVVEGTVGADLRPVTEGCTGANVIKLFGP